MDNKKVYALIVAGGEGTRMGSQIPKQFLSVSGKEMIEWSARKFISDDFVERVIVLVPEAWEDHTNVLFYDNGQIYVTTGGETRNDTLMKGIDFIEEKFGLDDDTIVMVHDAARPFVSYKMINDSVSAMDTYDAATVAIAATDSIAVSEDGETVKSCPDRSEIFMIQTPQTFKAKLYKKLYEQADDETKAALTESTRLFIENGYEVGMVEGGMRNMKVTASGDIQILELIYKKDKDRRERY